MKRALALLALCTAGTPALCSTFDINNLQNLSQSDFHSLAKDLGAALSYKPLESADPLGIVGFDVGVAVTSTSLTDTAAVQKAINSGTVYNQLPLPTLRVNKGLPLDIDVGLLYSKVPSSNISFYGGELRWAALAGTAVSPAVAVRLTATRLSGVSQLSQTTHSADVEVSKGFAFLTPYLGAGEVWSTATPRGVLLLAQEKLTQSKVYGGVMFQFGLFNMDLEADTTGGIRSYGAKFGLRF